MEVFTENFQESHQLLSCSEGHVYICLISIFLKFMKKKLILLQSGFYSQPKSFHVSQVYR